jgi:hypothetical protein
MAQPDPMDVFATQQQIADSLQSIAESLRTIAKELQLARLGPVSKALTDALKS